MTTLLRKMWRTHSKHKKLTEEQALAECDGSGWWREGKAPAEAGALRYAGATPVDRAASAPATQRAVRAALSGKTSSKKLQRVDVDISPKGIVVTDADTQDNVLSVSIYRISYCSADAANARIFAVVEGRSAPGCEAGAGESHVAHVFVCARRRHARALALALAHAFNDAYQSWQANQPSSLHGTGKRLAPWVQFPEEDEDEAEDAEEGGDWHSVAPLVTFA